jgi:hypothetical protein
VRTHGFRFRLRSVLRFSQAGFQPACSRWSVARGGTIAACLKAGCGGFFASRLPACLQSLERCARWNDRSLPEGGLRGLFRKQASACLQSFDRWARWNDRSLPEGGLRGLFRKQASACLQSLDRWARWNDRSLPEGGLRGLFRKQASACLQSFDRCARCYDCNLPEEVPASGGRHRHAVKIDGLGHVASAFRNQASAWLQSLAPFARRYDCNLPKGRLRVRSHSTRGVLAVRAPYFHPRQVAGPRSYFHPGQVAGPGSPATSGRLRHCYALSWTSRCSIRSRACGSLILSATFAARDQRSAAWVWALSDVARLAARSRYSSARARSPPRAW